MANVHCSYSLEIYGINATISGVIAMLSGFAHSANYTTQLHNCIIHDIFVQGTDHGGGFGKGGLVCLECSGFASLMLDNTEIYDVTTSTRGAVLYAYAFEGAITMEGQSSIHHVHAGLDGGAFFVNRQLGSVTDPGSEYFALALRGNASLTDNTAQVLRHHVFTLRGYWLSAAAQHSN